MGCLLFLFFTRKREKKQQQKAIRKGLHETVDFEDPN
jgi:ribosomal protein S3AE